MSGTAPHRGVQVGERALEVSGDALGERGAWGKRSLFENDARVPFIVADPRYPAGHGSHTPAFAELVDLFPTLTDLAGVQPPTALVPPLSGLSLAAVVCAAFRGRAPPLRRQWRDVALRVADAAQAA